MKKKTIYITIPEPCHQSRDEMGNVEGGKFCTSCNKTVTDFTTWSDTALYDFFSRNKTGVCGSFLSTQLDRNLQIASARPTAFYRIATAVGLTILLAQYPGSKGFAKTPYSYAYNFSFIHGEDAIPVDSTILRGYINSNNKPLSGAQIQLFQQGRLVLESKADTMGYYSMLVPLAGKYKLVVSKTELASVSNAICVSINSKTEYETKEKEIEITDQKINVENITLAQRWIQPIVITTGGPVAMPHWGIAEIIIPTQVTTVKKHKKRSKK